MAFCTLDDLAPRVKCNRITLEPIRNVALSTNTVNFGEYDVVVDASVFDYIDLEEGNSSIADYMLTDTFRDNVKIFAAYCRDDVTKSLFDYLTASEISTFAASGNPQTRGISPAQKTMLFITAGDMSYNVKNHSTYPILEENKSQIIAAVNAASNSELMSSNVITDYASATITNATHLAKIEDIFQQMQNGITDFFDAFPVNPDIFVLSLTFKAIYFRKLIRMAFSDMEFKHFTFSDIMTVDMSVARGTRGQDQDGNIVYDIKIPTQDLTFTNSIETTESYLYLFTVFDLQKAIEDKGVAIPTIPLDYETINFFFNRVDECQIIKDKRPASPMVQDFRISERVEEIIRTDLMTAYDQSIDNISLKTSEEVSSNFGITSDMFSSYVFTNQTINNPLIFTKNYFYLNKMKLLQKNSKLSFLYASAFYMNLDATFSYFDIGWVLAYLEIYKFDIYRVRLDEPAEPVLLPLPATEISTGFFGTINGAQLYKFIDEDFKNLTDGEYAYRLELETNDPMFAFVRTLTDLVSRSTSVLKGAIEYIHNNSAQYNELRDELSSDARSELLSRFLAMEFKSGFAALDLLIKMFTGRSMAGIGVADTANAIAWNQDLAAEWYANGADLENVNFMDTSQYFLGNEFSDVDAINRRKIENLYRISQDMLFAIEKHLATTDVYSSSEANNMDREYTVRTINYERTWKFNTVKADLDPRLMLGVQSRQYETLGNPQIRAEFEEEVNKHTVTISPTNFNKLNFLTPRYVGNHTLTYNQFNSQVNPFESFLKLMDASVQKPDIFERELAADVSSFLLGSPQEYDGSVSNLRNDAGVFETILHEQGVTISNLSAASINTDIEIESRVEYAYGIDMGTNELSEARRTFGYTEEELEEAENARDVERGLALASLAAEKQKLEELSARLLIDKNGYRMLNRRERIQGSAEYLQFKGMIGADYYNTAVRPHSDPSRAPASMLPHPRLLQSMLNSYFTLANSRTSDESFLKVIGARFVVDNVFMVYYMSGFDENMNALWKEMLVSEINSIPRGSLCKLVRFKMHGKHMNIGQGSTSNLEITNRYFYLS